MTAFRVPPRLAFVVLDDVEVPQVFLMPLPDGPPVVLGDISATIWVLAADGEEDVVGAVSEVVGRRSEMIKDDVETHLHDLVARGLLIGPE